MNQEKIGKFIAERRKEKNLTQEQFAEKLGVNSRSVSRWENAKTMPDISLYKDICKILDITINEFFAGHLITKNEVVNIDEPIDVIIKEYYKMKKQKNVIIKALILTIVGIIIMLGIFFELRFFGLIGYKYNEIYNDTIIADDIENIDVFIAAGELNIKQNNDDKIRIIAYGEHQKDIKISKINNTLKIDYPTYANSYYNFGNYSMDIIIYLPKKYDKEINIISDQNGVFSDSFEKATINIKSKDGSIKLGTFKNVTLDYNVLFGSVKIDKVTNMINIPNGKGNIRIKELDIKENSYIKTNDFGKIVIDKVKNVNINATSNKKTIIKDNNESSNIILELVSENDEIIVNK